MEGSIKLFRSILDSQVFAHQTALKIWIWCLCKANYKERFVSLKIGKGDIVIKIQPGQFIFGRFKAEDELGIDGSTIYKWIQKFASSEYDSMITIDSNNQYSVITICKWEEYQIQEGKKKTTKEQPCNNHVTAEEQPSNTDNKDNKVNKEEECKRRAQIFKESVFLFKDQYSEVMLNKFFDYWSESNKGKTKMRFELQQTFELSKRLATWHSRENSFDKNNKQQSVSSITIKDPRELR